MSFARFATSRSFGLHRIHRTALAFTLVSLEAAAQAVGSFPDTEEQQAPAPPPAPSPAPSPAPPPRPPPVATQPVAPSVAVQPRAPRMSGVPPAAPGIASSAPLQTPDLPAGGTPGGAMPRYILAPPVLPYHAGSEAPPGYELRTRANTGLIAGGVVIWAIGYGAGLVYAASQKFENGSGWSVVPIVGPWGAIGAREFGCDTSSVMVSRSDVDDCVNGALGEVEAITLLAVDGLLQAMGATLFFVGLASSEKQWVRLDVAGVAFVPSLTLRGGPKLGLHGVF